MTFSNVSVVSFVWLDEEGGWGGQIASGSLRDYFTLEATGFLVSGWLIENDSRDTIGHNPT